MEKPVIVISKCINFEPVRYNGGIVKDEFAEKFGKFVEYIKVCPEVSIGLPVPRDPLIVFKKDGKCYFIQEKNNKDLTDEILKFSESFLNSLKEVDGFLLKSKSPSCGFSKTNIYYEKNGKRFSYKGKGIFAQKISEKFPLLPVEDEGRLKNEDIKYNYILKLFSFFELKNVLKNFKSFKDILEFHQRYKYILMVYNQKEARFLGKLLASYNKKNEKEILEIYKNHFYRLFLKIPNSKSYINTLLHIYGYFKEKLNQKEKKHFLSLIEKYKKEQIPLKLLIEILKNFAFRFENEYLLNQKFLFPFSEELLE